MPNFIESIKAEAATFKASIEREKAEEQRIRDERDKINSQRDFVAEERQREEREIAEKRQREILEKTATGVFERTGIRATFDAILEINELKHDYTGFSREYSYAVGSHILLRSGGREEEVDISYYEDGSVWVLSAFGKIVREDGSIVLFGPDNSKSDEYPNGFRTQILTPMMLQNKNMVANVLEKAVKKPMRHIHPSPYYSPGY